MILVDTHCHLGIMPRDELHEVFARARKCNVQKFICIGAGEGIESAKKAVKLASEFDFVWATVGVHPHDASDFTALDELEELVSHPRVVAVGETGLDFFRDWSPRESQFTLFKNSINFAKKHKKPLIIHSRDASKDVLEVLTKENANEVGGVVHCFSEDANFAAELKKINFLVSFTGNITFKKSSSLREVVKEIPLSQIMLETDAPYMAPEPFRGNPSEPMHVFQVAMKIAELKGLTIEEVANVTTENAEHLFNV
jgi:TatD DNase family protein